MMTLSEVGDFEKKKGKILRSKILHIDGDFYADNTSIWRQGNFENTFGKLDPSSPLEWKRAKDLAENPEFISQKRDDTNGDITYNLDRGFLDSSWLLSVACGLQAVSPEVFAKVVPPDQGFDLQNYCGMFRFHFRRDGEWVEVVVDDFLPVDGNSVQVFGRSRGNPGEMWPCLLEKAYAKFKGGYHRLEGCKSRSCMMDLTSGVAPSHISLTVKKNVDPNLFSNLRARRRQALMCANIRLAVSGEEKGSQETVYEYPIVGFDELRDSQRKRHKLIGILNPHRMKEWNNWLASHLKKSSTPGGSHRLPKEIIEEMEYRNKEGGEFWLLFDDFTHHFDSIDVCHLDPSTIEPPATCFGLQVSPRGPVMALMALLVLANLTRDLMQER